MILVDIFVPSVDKTYDFQLNETVTVKMLIEEISEMIGQKERCRIIGNVDDLQLCDKANKCMLSKEKTLNDCGIITGSSLILI